MDEDIIFVCHRCHAEFGFGEPPEDAEPVETTASGGDASLPLLERVMDPSSPPAQPGPDEAPDETSPFKPEDTANVSPETLPDMEHGMPTVSDTPAEEKTFNPSEAMADDERHPVPDPESNARSPATPAGADPWPDEAGGAAGPSEPHAPVSVGTPSAPRPPRARVLPWLVGVLFVVAILGFWTQRDAWLDNPGLRATLINLGAPLAVRDKDWRIPPASVHAEWINRDDGSQVLVIEGRVKSLLECELPPPYIRVSVFDRARPGHVLVERTLPITRPPLMTTIRHAPFAPPPVDMLPVAPLGDRGFVLVLEQLPANAGEFTLTPAARNRER